MTNDFAPSALMESSDIKATLLAAIARIESVPVGKTLIDEISDAEWLDDCVATWHIELGSESLGNESADELDLVDKEVVQVA